MKNELHVDRPDSVQEHQLRRLVDTHGRIHSLSGWQPGLQ
jgi:hypothetical protein